jgi:hypothetical protein
MIPPSRLAGSRAEVAMEGKRAFIPTCFLCRIR